MKRFTIGIVLCFLSFLVVGQHRQVDSTVQVIILPAKTKLVPMMEAVPTISKLDSFINYWIGRPYRYGGTTIKGVDCSSFVQKLYSEVFDLLIPRTAQTQYKAATKVSKNSMTTGDLLFFMSHSSPSGWHVAIYLGNNMYMHAANKKVGVVIDELTAAIVNKVYAVGRFSKASIDFYSTILNYKAQTNVQTKTR